MVANITQDQGPHPNPPPSIGGITGGKQQGRDTQTQTQPLVSLGGWPPGGDALQGLNVTQALLHFLADAMRPVFMKMHLGS